MVWISLMSQDPALVATPVREYDARAKSKSEIPARLTSTQEAHHKALSLLRSKRRWFSSSARRHLRFFAYGRAGTSRVQGIPWQRRCCRDRAQDLRGRAETRTPGSLRQEACDCAEQASPRFIVCQRRSGRKDVRRTCRSCRAAHIPRPQTCLYRWRHHHSAIPCCGMHRPIGDHASARADRDRHPFVWLSAARHQSSPRRDALL
jgi:hypothetical protein